MDAQQIEEKYGITARNATIADILWLAANVYLKSDKYECGTDTFSCLAVMEACCKVYGVDSCFVKYDSIKVGLRNMGVICSNSNQFDDVPFFERQQARYNWLMFAHLIATEQGV